MSKPNNILKGYRVMAGYTQEDIAKKLEVIRLTYLSKENGASNFSFSEKQIIFDVLKERLPNLTMEEVFPLDEV